MEYVSLEGLRLDGRRPRETRQMRCQMSVLPNADGSALFEAGNTKVLAAVYGPREAPIRSRSLHDRMLVQCEFSMASFSTGERRRRTKGDRKSVEIGLVIKQALETAMITELLPRSQVDVNIQVLQADGGVRAAAINAAVLAIADAGIPLRDTMAACAAGFLDNTPLLDLNYLEVRVFERGVGGGADESREGTTPVPFNAEQKKKTLMFALLPLPPALPLTPRHSDAQTNAFRGPRLLPSHVYAFSRPPPRRHLSAGGRRRP